MIDDYDYKKLKEEVFNFEERGFKYLPEIIETDKEEILDAYKLPCGDILTEKELLDFFKTNKPEFGNRKHIEISNAQYYSHLINFELFDLDKQKYK